MNVSKIMVSDLLKKVKLDLISDVDMYLLLETTMRGSVSYISKRYSKVNLSGWIQ